MVSSRIVDYHEDLVEEPEVELPQMVFADGEEPVGVRVLTYQSSRAINTILNALNEAEIQYLRESSFGKLIEIAEKPAFSGRFARYLLSRQLKVEKKHEAWFRFAGNPIRFSLREFAIVTGLPCGEIPKKQKMKKKNINEKPYWPELFGSMEEMRVSQAVKMLRKKTVTDPDIRMKLACLAIVSSVLLSTNLKMKMLKEYAELLGDIEEFLSFPWGRIAFDMLMTSIKKRDEISLSQDTIALKGFALALQLVIVEAVPALTEVVQDACSSSESESDDDEIESPVSKARRKTLNPAHAREVDRKSEAVVNSIIPEDPHRPLNDSVLGWPDEVFDIKVDNLLKLIFQKFVFSKDMFKGGVTKSDVEKMREDSKPNGKKKQTRGKEKQSIEAEEDKISPIVLSLLKPELQRIEGKVSSGIDSMKQLALSSVQYKDDVLATVSGMIKQMKSEILVSLAQGHAHEVSGCHNIILSDGHVSKPSSSKQLTGRSEAGNGHAASECHPINPSSSNASIPPCSNQPAVEGDDENNRVIANVLENLSHYSTPPGSPNQPPVSDGRGQDEISSLPTGGKLGESKHQLRSISRPELNGTLVLAHQDKNTIPRRTPLFEFNNEASSGSKLFAPVQKWQSKQNLAYAATNVNVGDSRPQMSTLSGHSGTEDRLRSDFDQPSFSLGLTQEKDALPSREHDQMGENNTHHGLETHLDTFLSRKSKCIKTVPQYLLSGYQCGSSILNRAREGQLCGGSYYDMSVVRDKYARLSTLLKKPW
ncbi:Uncharacterized protein Rs2_18607 [Raphanus sativus]|nr:Uncharacterized protein Rs2_18607 [Raphanus sativus]